MVHRYQVSHQPLRAEDQDREAVGAPRPNLACRPRRTRRAASILSPASISLLTDGNVFQDDPGIQVRYLRDDEDGDPRSVSPWKVAALVRDGLPVYADSDDAAPCWRRQTSRPAPDLRGTMTMIVEWFRQYPAHVFCLAAPSDRASCPSWQKLVEDVIPAEVYRRLAADRAPTVATFGTGSPPRLSSPFRSRSARRSTSNSKSSYPSTKKSCPRRST